MAVPGSSGRGQEAGQRGSGALPGGAGWVGFTLSSQLCSLHVASECGKKSEESEQVKSRTVVTSKGHACLSPQAALVSMTVWLIAALLNLHPK